MAGEGLYHLTKHVIGTPGRDDPASVRVDIFLLADRDSEPVMTLGGPEAANVWDHAQTLRDAGQRDAFVYGVLMGTRFVDGAAGVVASAARP